MNDYDTNKEHQNVPYAEPTTADERYYLEKVTVLEPIKPEIEPSRGCNDIVFAIIFILQLIATLVLLGIKGIPVITTLEKESKASNADLQIFNHFLVLVAVVIVSAVFASTVLLSLIIKYAKLMVIASFIIPVCYLLALTILCFLVKNVEGGIVILFSAALIVIFYFVFRKHIPFATASLQVSSNAIKSHPSLYGVAIGAFIVQLIWVLICITTMVGILMHLYNSNKSSTSTKYSKNNEKNNDSEKNTAIALYIFILFSCFWGCSVISNISHVTVAGTIGAWWKQENSKGATGKALKRSITTSFGSICFASLVLALVQLLRSYVETQRRGSSLSAVLVAECCISCIEEIIKFINQWGLVYVGIYGFPFIASGKATYSLMQQRGFSAIASNTIMSQVMGLLVATVALFCGGITALVTFAFSKFFECGIPSNYLSLITGLSAFCVGLILAYIPFSIVISTALTIFVCFAEDPAIFAQSHPDLYSILVQAWNTVYPEQMHAMYAVSQV